MSMGVHGDGSPGQKGPDEPSHSFLVITDALEMV
jgi:hypothetical protein